MLWESPAREVKSVRTASRLVSTTRERDGATFHELSEHLDIAKKGIDIGRAVVHALSAAEEDLSSPAWWIVAEFGRGLFVEKTVPTAAGSAAGSASDRTCTRSAGDRKPVLTPVRQA